MRREEKRDEDPFIFQRKERREEERGKIGEER